MPAKKKPETRELGLTTQQVEKLNALVADSAATQLALQLYLSGILDGHGLEGTWSFGDIHANRVEVVKAG